MKSKRKTVNSDKKTPILNNLGNQHIFIEAVTPSVDEGLYPAKGVVGKTCVVEADIFRDGHDILQACVKWRRQKDSSFHSTPMRLLVNDRWTGEFPLSELTDYVFTVEAWTDHFSSWLADLKKRVNAGVPFESELFEGIRQIEMVAPKAKSADEEFLVGLALQLNKEKKNSQIVIKLVSDNRLLRLMQNLQPRSDLTQYSKELIVQADRPLSEFGTWYELFVRSQGKDPKRSGTFKDVEGRLDDIKAMGFDVLYLTPIHPIGRTARKGPNNKLKAGPNDPGSPWAIGNENGGHTAIEPSLGTMADFDQLVKKANKKGIEIALDFAIQCSPDHPWVKEHPGWFYQRSDGSIKYAENPPKKYEDIYPINFDCEDQAGLYQALKDIVLHWIGHGVRIFRVDNPHTKPLLFWQWLIAEIHKEHKDVIFLAEAFTRPKVMKALAKIGFTQSYTYFTWRNYQWDIKEYMTELTTSGMQDYYRPNFFVNTPDILTEILQKGGEPAFKMRLVLAATLSSIYGIYSGYEFCENQAIPGTEDYLNSEKYEIRVRDWNSKPNIKSFIASVNAIRRENPALQTFKNIKFFHSNNDQILAYAKMTPDRSNVIIVAVNLDPFHAHHGSIWIPLEEIGIKPGGAYEVKDLITNSRYTWSDNNFLRLDPQFQVAHILRIEKKL